MPLNLHFTWYENKLKMLWQRRNVWQHKLIFNCVSEGCDNFSGTHHLNSSLCLQSMTLLEYKNTIWVHKQKGLGVIYEESFFLSAEKEPNHKITELY